MSGTAMYTVRRLAAPVTINGRWDKPPWTAIGPLTLDRFMGGEPSHRPPTAVKLAYDDDALYVIFRVKDRYVRSVTTALHGPVCTDSCVEFFFTPGPERDAGYLNLEVNAGGAMLFQRQRARGASVKSVSEADCRRITVASSLPRVVDPEITEPVVWTIEYRLPVAILPAYQATSKPRTGVTWRANFYKCADRTSHPHWLTWSNVEMPAPDFHQPRFFGTLLFA